MPSYAKIETRESTPVTEPILSHTFPNGLVLVAEPMHWLQSAAFTFLVPAGCVYDPPSRGGLSSFTCEMALRGAGPRDSRQFVLDLDNLGVERSESVSDAHASYSGATLAENLPEALAIFADVLRRPHLPDDQLEAGRQVVLQELRAVEDEPAEKVMIELRRRHYPQPWGRPSQGEQEALEAITHRRHPPYFQQHYRPNGTILGVAGRIDWEPLRGPGGPAAGRLGSRARPSRGRGTARRGELPARPLRLEPDADRHRLRTACPTGIPTISRPGARWACLSGGMSARLFTEVRERRGLCYSVYAAYHTLRDRGGVFCYAGTGAERAQETLDVTLGELVRLGQGIEEHELDRLKARIKSALIMQQESSSARSSSLARDWYHLGRARTLDEVGRLVDGLTCREHQRLPGRASAAGFHRGHARQPRELEVPGGVS